MTKWCETCYDYVLDDHDIEACRKAHDIIRIVLCWVVCIIFIGLPAFAVFLKMITL